MKNPTYQFITPAATAGKVSKTWTISQMYEHAKQRSVVVRGIDADSDHRSFSHLYEEVTCIELSDQPAGDFLRALTKAQSGVTIIDPQAHRKESLLEAVVKSGLLESPEHRFTMVIFPQDLIEVMEDVAQTVATLQDKVQWVVVLNRGRSRSFRMYEGSDLESELTGYGAARLDLPVLLQDTIQHIAACALRAGRPAIPFREVLSEGDELGIHLGHRGFLQAWMREVYGRLDLIADHLYLPEDAARIMADRAQILASATTAVTTPVGRKVNANID